MANGMPRQMLVRSAPPVTADFTFDVKLFNDQQNFEHPGRHVVEQSPAQIAGAAQAVQIVADYPAGQASVRTADVIARGADSKSYHLTLISTPDEIGRNAVRATALSLRLPQPTSPTPPHVPLPPPSGGATTLAPTGSDLAVHLRDTRGYTSGWVGGFPRDYSVTLLQAPFWAAQDITGTDEFGGKNTLGAGHIYAKIRVQNLNPSAYIEGDTGLIVVGQIDLPRSAVPAGYTSQFFGEPACDQSDQSVPGDCTIAWTSQHPPTSAQGFFRLAPGESVELYLRSVSRFDVPVDTSNEQIFITPPFDIENNILPCSPSQTANPSNPWKCEPALSIELRYPAEKPPPVIVSLPKRCGASSISAEQKNSVTLYSIQGGTDSSVEKTSNSDGSYEVDQWAGGLAGLEFGVGFGAGELKRDITVSAALTYANGYKFGLENEADADQVVSLFKGALSGDAATAAATIANSHIDESYWNTGADLEGDAVFGVDAKVSIASTVGYSRTKTGDIITTSVLSGKLDISATAAKYRKDAGELALGFGGDIEQELLYTMDDKETPKRLEVATTAGVKLTAEGSTSWTNDKVVNAIKKAESSGGAAAGGVVEVRAELGLTNEGDRAAAFMSALTNPSDDLGLVTAVASLYADTADIKVRAYAQADLTTGLRAKLAKGIVFDFDFGTTQTWKNLLFAFRGGADNLIVDKLCSTSAGTAKG